MGINTTINYTKESMVEIGRQSIKRNHSVKKNLVKKLKNEIFLKLARKHQNLYDNPKSYKWTEISAELNQSLDLHPIRLGKHCRERWFNYLDPNLSKLISFLQKYLFFFQKKF